MLRVAAALAALALAPPAVAEAGPAAPASMDEPDDAEPRPGDGRRAPDLGLRLRLAPTAGALAVEPARVHDTPPPPCVADYCQPRVDVPGIEGFRRRASRTELFVSLLDRAQLEPIASVAWFFVVTGLRVDWTPAAMDESFGATAGGWGNLFVRLRMRIDAWNLPAIPMRPRERMRRERELAAERARAADAVRLRRLAAGLPGPVPAAPGARAPSVAAHVAGDPAPRGM